MKKHPLIWKKFPVLNDGFICLVDYMGNDSRIVQAARTSYGKDERDERIKHTKPCCEDGYRSKSDNKGHFIECSTCGKQYIWKEDSKHVAYLYPREKDRGLIRRLMMDGHTSPFEKVKFEFLVRVPMDCWRQWIRHRTADVNEYSTRYSEAIDSQQTTDPNEWRLQAKDNKQGSSGFLTGDVDQNNLNLDHNLILDSNEYQNGIDKTDAGSLLSNEEVLFHKLAKNLYQTRLALGVAREQARKDLPLSTYTEAYWGCSLHNIFNFLRLRMDEHAQLEIRLYANAMAEIIKQVVPVAWEAFEDYVLYGQRFSRMEMEVLKQILSDSGYLSDIEEYKSMNSMTDNEWAKFLKKLS